MNEYQERDLRKVRAIHGKAQEIAAELGPDWSARIEPDADGNECYGCVYIEGPDITVHVSVPWNKPEFLHFNLGWQCYPEVTDRDGHTNRVTESDWLRRDKNLPAAEMNANNGRPAKAIARELVRKVIEPGAVVLEACRELAASRQQYADEEVAALKKLAAAAGDKWEPRTRIFYMRVNGDMKYRVEYESKSSAKICLTPDDMADVLGFLRAKHSRAAANG